MTMTRRAEIHLVEMSLLAEHRYSATLGYLHAALRCDIALDAATSVRKQVVDSRPGEFDAAIESALAAMHEPPADPKSSPPVQGEFSEQPSEPTSCHRCIRHRRRRGFHPRVTEDGPRSRRRRRCPAQPGLPARSAERVGYRRARPQPQPQPPLTPAGLARQLSLPTPRAYGGGSMTTSTRLCR